MTKTVLAMLLGAFCACAWWGAAIANHPALWFLSVLSSIGTMLWIAYETSEAIDNKK